MKFDTLRLSGFKSFVDPTELRLEAGLTGIVGPNGCGKSNILEAMRWVMGDSSAKAMRGEGMDDVIFAGAASRPPRNFAEVSLMIGNDEGLAPPQFGNPDSLDVSRRITREVGSVYRVNGKETRARDVKMLFADAASGAQSPALVRQGRIGELIAAKPQARRRFLEEAAGVSGLNVRRREAELKLKAAEENLLRVDDVLMRLDAQIASLQRQARQAARYTKLSDQIQETAALLVWLRYAEAEAEAVTAQSALDAATRTVAAANTAASQAARERETAAEALPPLREEAAIAQAVYQRLIAKRDGLDAEAERARATLARLEADCARIAGDLTREGELAADARRTLETLQTERAALDAAEDRSAEIATAAAAVQDAAAQVADAETGLDTATSRAAAASAERSAAERAHRTAQTALADAESRRAAAAPRLEKLAEDIADADAALVQAETEQAALTAPAPDDIAQAEAARSRLEADEAAARSALAEARARADALISERTALEQALALEASGDRESGIVTKLRAAPGYEAALAAALGADAAAPERMEFSETAHGWRALGAADIAAPLAGEPLSAHIDAPEALSRRLAATAIVAREDGPEAQKHLLPGQRLVSREGDLWRWDGYFSGAESRAKDPAAAQLARRNRLDALTRECAEADRARQSTADTLETLTGQLAEARQAETQARTARRAAEDAAAAAARRLADARATVERLHAAQSQLSEDAERHADAEIRARAALTEAEEVLSRTGDPETLRAEADAARNRLTDLRRAHDEAKTAHDDLTAAERRRADRLATLARELEDWRARATKAEARSTELQERQATAQADRDAAQSAPDEIAALRDALAADLTEAETRVAAATDTLSTAEAAARKAASADTEAAAALSTAREDRARAEALGEAAEQRKTEAAAALREETGAAPEETAARFAEAGVEREPVSEVEERLSKLKASRERLGAVNLRAKIEIEEAETERTALGTERDEVEQAIGKLRKGLAALNREGRERLLAAFTEVNRHFSGLFTHLFGGGEARLELTESDDPLEAGLEILCQPPGKRLQSLSLLSGGEQTLTALALIFAVFLVNPAPVCVLDEVDAPLDDANVARFCDLLDEMTRRADARFLIITHHAVTMARMNRLYGVTMAERGVSRLVSVDLGAAVDLVATEQAA